ncbi:sigma-E processing peptidase SpoIIGA [Brevibacillus daliensis]|uniref:sigma-E processing peptidase SpoIIGA n=1 Tax=Brevibacillus daliensis TaxID=2892995 RepID=UPI001E2F6E49|nr:sigma-E processing peptidase SpoIIGA [Brevibacillus daliensis]
MVIYLDIILLFNFAIDALLLWFTAYFRKERVVWWRIMLASAVGSSYVALFFFPAFSGLYQWFTKLLFSVVILWISFGYSRLFHFFQHVVIFYFVAFVFGGGVFALTYLMAEQSEIVNGILITHNDSFGVGAKPSLLILVAGFVMVFFLSKKSYHSIQEPRRLHAFMVEVAVTFHEKTVGCKGLVDTGNQLHEPISRIPVMVMESSLFAGIIPDQILRVAEGEGGKLEQLESIMDELPEEWQGRVRLIPFRSVSSGFDFLLALKPDHVFLEQNGVSQKHTRVLIGLQHHPLSPDRKYQSIVHPALMQQEESQGIRHIPTPVEQEG